MTNLRFCFGRLFSSSPLTHPFSCSQTNPHALVITAINPEPTHESSSPEISAPKLEAEIQCLCKGGDVGGALEVLSFMHHRGFIPPESLYWCLLKACNKQNALSSALIVQRHLSTSDLGYSSFLRDYLVSTLAKCGGLQHALEELYSLQDRTVYSWTAVISASVDSGANKEALEMYCYMEDDHVQPNEYTYVSILKACGNIPDLTEGMALHTDILVKGIDAHVFVGSTLVSMYGKSGSLFEAFHVFTGLSERNIVSWNAMISGYAEHSETEKALRLYEQMKVEGLEPNERTYVSLLQACSMLLDRPWKEDTLRDDQLMHSYSIETLKILHADIRSKGFEENVYVANSLVSTFSKCGSIDRAENVFCGTIDSTVISWTAMLSAYTEHGDVEKALQLYAKMRNSQVNPNEWTFAIVLQACCLLADKEDLLIVGGLRMKLLALEIGRALHADARMSGLDLDPCVGSTLVSMYGKCGSIIEAENIFSTMLKHDIISWNALLSAYLDKGRGETVLHLYTVMQANGISPDERTYVIAFQACCVLAGNEETVFIGGRSMKTMCLEIGFALHTDAQLKGFGSDVFVSSILVNMYGKCGSILDGETVFAELAFRDAVTWTAMLSAYVEQGEIQNALQLYEKMQEEDVIVDDATLVCVIQACSHTGTLGICRQIQFDILSTRSDLSVILTTAFIHAYGNCSSMKDACATFNELPDPDVVAWSALMSGFAKEGHFATSFEVYDEMKLANVQPNEVTFLSLISACGHAGLVDKGVEMFESMNTSYALSPKVEHFVTVVDLLGRLGDLERAESILSRMPMKPDLAMWLCLLAACRKHGNVELGKRVFTQAIDLHPNKAAAYIMMSNIYNDCGRWECASHMNLLKHDGSAWEIFE